MAERARCVPTSEPFITALMTPPPERRRCCCPPSFYANRIPVLHLFPGAHERYHTPDDTAETLNYPGAAQVVDFTSRIVETLARGEATPKYARVTSAPAMEGDSRGYGAYLGTIP